jgi:predicted ATP-grasp superfamily ATP-dependent carboligase
MLPNGSTGRIAKGTLLKRPVLVLGWIPRIVVTVARSLHRHGVPVDVADFALAPRPASRAVREFRRLPCPDSDPSGFVAQLSDFVRQGQHDMVIPTDDQTLMALVEHYGDLRNLAYVACPPPEITCRTLDKPSSLELAQKCGLRVPTTKLISNSAQLYDLLSSFPFPWVLKPARKEIRVENIKSWALATAEEVAAKFPSAQEFTPPMLLQEYCAGAGVGVEMLMHKGECVAVFQHRRLEEFPYTGGYSVTAIAEQPDPVLVESSLALLRAMQWEGPAMVEFKVNAREGSATFMEVNGRNWGTIALPIFAGMDFPVYHWQLVHGEIPAVPANYKVGTRWRWTAGHVFRIHGLLASARRSALARKELWRSPLHFAAALGPSTHDALFSPSDPMPAIFELIRTFHFLCLDDAKTLWKRLSPARRQIAH